VVAGLQSYKVLWNDSPSLSDDISHRSVAFSSQKTCVTLHGQNGGRAWGMYRDSFLSSVST